MRVHELLTALKSADPNGEVSAYAVPDKIEFDIHVVTKFKRTGAVVLASDDSGMSAVEILLHKDAP